ncbi:MAG: (E)-4-hydroxy-3-methylbut-2-enyl-diphosphate synthase [Spirochaetia bacterium]|nr:(E)-4-hydroxy-3-methylbut-2-enyl-diphosphate synthase [Spirochaetia bacterium]
MQQTLTGLPPTLTGRYVDNPFTYVRRRTREVMIGSVGVGGKNPIRIQSMTVADTMDTAAVVKETLGLVEAGCEIVRITAPRLEEARNLGEIKRELLRLGCKVPLVADIHFQPQAALEAAEHVEKVRINPGNYADRKRFEIIEYSDKDYQEELERIHDSFKPLVLRMKELGRALRIGTNHGSLSDRIMNRFGDTPMGMVESALEFIRICRQYDFHSIVVSMKSSNPQVMVQAYRMLCEAFDKEDMDYPLHLGVTEAGLGLDGRMKSAVGIGTLLEDGIGDTIRVSLTEDSIHEIPAARRIAERYQTADTRTGSNDDNGSGTRSAEAQAAAAASDAHFSSVNPYAYQRLKSDAIRLGAVDVGSKHPVRLAVRLRAENPSHWDAPALASLLKEGCDIVVIHAANRSEAERLSSIKVPVVLEARGDADDVLALLTDAIPADGNGTAAAKGTLPPLAGLSVIARESDGAKAAAWTRAAAALRLPLLVSLASADQVASWKDCAQGLGLYAPDKKTGGPHEIRRLLSGRGALPLLLRAEYASADEALFSGSIQAGSALLDGMGDILLADVGSPEESLRFGLDLLQATRLRMSKTEYISCPSCGRTLFDLQDTTARIKARTGHLKGAKIAVMGCIVNGPGEMADADFGYVGAGPGRIHLYRGKELVKRNLPSETADEELVALIKEHGMWVEP